MAKTKYIRLYEEYTELEKNGSDKSHSWQEIRDAMQLKLPFIIIDFKNSKSFDKCYKEELFDEDTVKQIYYSKLENADVTEYPSVFIFGEGNGLSDRVLGFIKRYDILRIIIGEYGKSVPQLYTETDNVDLDSNLLTSLEIDEMGGDDYYKIGTHFYKFIL